MFFSPLGRSPVKKTNRSNRFRRRPVLLFVEALEHRVVPTVSYKNGPLIANVQIETIYFGSNWGTSSTLQAEAAKLNDFLNKITDSTYMDNLAQYSVTSPTTFTIGHGPVPVIDSNNPATPAPSVQAGNDDDNDAALDGTSDADSDLTSPGGDQQHMAITETNIQDMIKAEVAAGNVDAPNANTLYFVFIQPGVLSAFDTDNGFGGHHRSFTDSGKTYYYAVIPLTLASQGTGTFDQSFDSLTAVSSHELSEAITDPILDTGWDQGDASHEIGDLCEGEAGAVVSYHGYMVQKEYSNAAVAAGEDDCVLEIDKPLTNMTISTSPNPTEGQTVTVTVNFLDTDNTYRMLPVPSDFTPTFDWGDGTTTTSGFTINDLGGGNFSVSAMHTYTEEGPNSFNAEIDDVGGSKITGGQTIQVADPAVVPTGSFTVSAVEGTDSGSQVVATFTDPGGAEVTGDYSADINWGDGSPTQIGAGVISYNGSYFTVMGDHTYAEESTPDHVPGGGTVYTITVTINHEGATPPASTTSSAAVSDPAVAPAGNFTFKGLEGAPSASQTVATFTDPGGPENDGLASTYVATVHFSDGTPDTIATLANGGIVLGADGVTFFVNVGHTSPEDGTYSVTTTINHEGEISAPVTSTAIIKDNIGILLLDPSGTNALQDSGNGQVSVVGIYGGAILVNSTNSQAVSVGGNGSVSASETDVGGSPGIKISGKATVSGETNLNEAPYADPLASLPAPTPSAAPFPAAIISGTSSVTLLPGTYLGGISVSGQASVTLTQGTYVLEGGGFSVSGHATVTGQQVMLFNLPSKPGDSIQVGAQATLTLTAPISGTYKGIAIFQAGAASAPTLQLSGQSNTQVTGTVYASGALVQAAGSAVLHLQGDPINLLGAHLIVSDLQVSGNGVVTVDASFNNLALFDPPPPPNTPVGDTPLTSAQISALLTANLPTLVNVSYVAFVNDNPTGVTNNLTPAAVQDLALKLILEELPSAGVTGLDQLMALELSAIDQAFAILES
jgi:hypothetical protein